MGPFVQQLILSMLLLTFSACSTRPVEFRLPEPATSAVARVNGVEITRKSYAQEILAARAQMTQIGQSVDEDRFGKIRDEILADLIDSELLYQDSLKKGVLITDAQVDAEMNSLKRRFANEKAFEKWLDEMNMSVAEMKEKYKKSTAVEALVTQQITRDVTVSEEEIKQYYDNHPEEFASPLFVRASHILIAVAPEATPGEKETAMKKMKAVEEKLKKGEDFSELAKQYSEGPSRVNGGDIGHFQQGDMVKPFEDTAFAMPVGAVSGIVETRFGYHLITVTDKQQDAPVPFKIATYDIRKKITWEKSMKKLDAHLNTIRKDAKIEIFRSSKPGNP